jgi:hypothetical protein
LDQTAVLRRIVASLDRLRELTNSQLTGGAVSFEQLVTEYVSLRRNLARDFQQLAEGNLVTEDPALDIVRRRITQRMKERFGGRVPDRYLRVKGYKGVHRILFEYFARNVGTPVPGSRLRVLTGDQIHTERRLRELRDLGFDLTSTRAADDDQYVLRSTTPDLDFAAGSGVARNIRNDRKLPAEERYSLLVTLGLADRADEHA